MSLKSSRRKSSETSTPLVEVARLIIETDSGLYNFLATLTAFLRAVVEILFSTTSRKRQPSGISVSGTLPSAVKGIEMNGFGEV